MYSTWSNTSDNYIELHFQCSFQLSCTGSNTSCSGPEWWNIPHVEGNYRFGRFIAYSSCSDKSSLPMYSSSKSVLMFVDFHVIALWWVRCGNITKPSGCVWKLGIQEIFLLPIIAWEVNVIKWRYAHFNLMTHWNTLGCYYNIRIRPFRHDTIYK